VKLVKRPPKRKAFKARPKPAYWKAIHDGAFRRIPAFRRAFRATMREASDGVSMPMLVGLLERNRPDMAVDLFSRDLIEAAYGKRLLPLIKEGMESAAKTALPTVTEFGKAYTTPPSTVTPGPTLPNIAELLTMANPSAIQAAALLAAAEVTVITEGTKAALREIIRQAQETGIAIPDQAQRIARELKAVANGITEPQAKTLGRLKAGWREAGLSEARIAELTAQTTERMINQRSLVIARNETMESASRGVEELWNNAVRQDLIPADVEREWLTQPGLDAQNPCPICRGMNGQKRPLGQYFVSPYNGARAKRPPIHVACLCIVVIARR